MQAQQPKPFKSGWLEVGQGHELYVAQYGNPKGISLLYLHGGPGAGCCIEDLSLFDLSVYRVILLDQRGAGRSRPRGELQGNSLMLLLGDIERVRCWLDIPQWMLAGGSFGATLALLYSACYPSRVVSQVLWGLFIPNKEGIKWLYGDSGAARLFADDYAQFQITAVRANSLAELFTHYRNGIDNPCHEVRQHFALKWNRWEMALAYPSYGHELLNAHSSQSLASIELYYVANDYFGAFEKLSQKLPLIQSQTYVLQGELDWVCPFNVVNSFFKGRASQLIKVTEIKGAYHALADVKMAKAVINAIREMAKQ